MSNSSCYSTVEKLINYLKKNDDDRGLWQQLALSDEDITDALWLALQMGEQESQSAPKEDHPTKAQPQRKGKESKDEGQSQFKKTPSQDKPFLSPQDIPNTEKKEEEKTIKSKGLPFQTPSASALPQKLAISRALRPLMRKVPSPTRNKIDIEATVTRIAEQDIWLPVTKPEPERWFDLELIIEQSSSSFIWEETMTELEKLFSSHGAFRRVRSWTLWNFDNLSKKKDKKKSPSQKSDLESIKKTNLKLTRRKKENSAIYCQHRHGELISSNGRSLIILVSDCVSLIWQQPTIYEWLELWCQKVPTTIMQLFPEKLWLSTELGLGYKVKFSALTPGVSNSKLVCNEDFSDEQTINLPVITLEPESIKDWAKVIVGCGSIQTPGIVLDLEFLKEQTKKIVTSPTQNLTTEMIVDRFLNTASLTAQRLAGYMAVVPVSLPVVHLIQDKLFAQKCTPVHVAEVFLSGMIERKKTDTALSNFDTFDSNSERKNNQYYFIKGARELLNQAMPISETINVLDTLSEYIAEKLGLEIKTFTALLFRQQDLTKEQQKYILPFAYVAVEVLNNLGGEYAEFAQEIEVINQEISLLSFFDFKVDLSEFDFKLQTLDIEETETINLKTFTSKTVFVDKQGEISREEPVTAYYFEEELAEGIKLNMMQIPTGEFWMGTDDDEIERLVKKFDYEYFREEKPQHKVTIKQEFYMSQTPITQGQWKAVTKLPQVGRELKENPSEFKGDDNLPVENVDWYDAIEFCARLSQKTGKNYRLPSEAEWEYACRAINNPVDEQEELNPEEKKQKSWLENITGIFRGNQEQQSQAESSTRYPPFSFGETITDKLANYGASNTYEEESPGEYRQKTTPVGQFYPNAFGLYDMHGNVWEWCADTYYDNYNGATDDGSVWDENNNDNRYQNYLEHIDTLLNNSREKVIRGGSWGDAPSYCRSAFRLNYNAEFAVSLNLGVRVVCG